MKTKLVLILLTLSTMAHAANVQYRGNWRVEHDTAYSNYSSLNGKEELVIECQLGTVVVNSFDSESGKELSSNDDGATVIVNGLSYPSLRDDKERKMFYNALGKRSGYIQLVSAVGKTKTHPLKGLNKEIEQVEWALSDCRE